MARVMALELAPHRIRVNIVCPGLINTPILHNDTTYSLFSGGKQDVTWEDVAPGFAAQNKLPITLLEPVDISNAMLYLVSDMGRYVTGVTLPVDAGFTMK